MKKIPPKWCQLLTKAPSKLSGGAADNYVDCHALAEEIYGPREKLFSLEFGAASFMYLFRRFGPSPWGYDDYKALSEYIIGTPMKGVFLTLYPRGSGLGIGYLVSEKVRAALDKPQNDWMQAFIDFCGNKTKHKTVWDAFDDKPLMKRAVKKIGENPVFDRKNKWRKSLNPTRKKVNKSLFDAMIEMLRPTSVRDVRFNLLGRCEDINVTSVEPHESTGFGVKTLKAKM